MAKIKKGDEIIVIAGKDKGRRGEVLRVIDDRKVVVTNVNIAKKHQKANPSMNIAGGIIEREMPFDISNVMLYNPITKKGDRIGFKNLEDGRKVRIFKSNKEVIDV